MRYGFRTLLVASILFSVAMAAYVATTSELRERQRITSLLRDAGASAVAFQNQDGNCTLVDVRDGSWRWSRWTGMTPGWSYLWDRGDVDWIVFEGRVPTEGISAAPSIESIHFSDCRSKDLDVSLVHLSKLPRLQILHLNRSGISDAGIANLAKLESVKILRLGETSVTDACIDDLAAIPNLKSVSLVDTKVTEAGFARLKTLRPDLFVYRGWQPPVPAP